MDLERMRALLAALQEARYAGVRSVSYDGKTLFSATDNTFGEAGGVALWTKADSVTEFDQFREEEIR